MEDDEYQEWQLAGLVCLVLFVCLDSAVFSQGH